MPPDIELIPSNVMIFELVYLSSKSSSDDITMGWGAFPIVNGDFQINQGKFKVPLINGPIDYQTDAFKNIESKFRRNVDEWLCNLYIDVKKIDLIDFHQYESKICFTTKKKKQKRTLKDKAKRILFGIGGEHKGDDGSSDSSESVNSDISDDSTDEVAGGEYVDHDHIQYHDYVYCANKTPDFVTNEEDAQNIAFRKAEFILNEILADMGIAKAGAVQWTKNLLLAALMLQLRMFCHYMG